MHENLVNIIERLNRKLTGMYAYYGINGMFKDLMGLYKYTKYELYRVMCRRSQKKIKNKEIQNNTKENTNSQTKNICTNLVEFKDIYEEPYARKPHVRFCEGQ